MTLQLQILYEILIRTRIVVWSLHSALKEGRSPALRNEDLFFDLHLQLRWRHRDNVDIIGL